MGVERLGLAAIASQHAALRAFFVRGRRRTTFQTRSFSYGGLADVNPLNTWTYDGHRPGLWNRPPCNRPGLWRSAVFEPNLEHASFSSAAATVEWTKIDLVVDGFELGRIVSLHVAGPARRLRHGYDRNLGRTHRIFGGQGNGPVGDTWELFP